MDEPTPKNLTERTRLEIREALAGRRRGWRAFVPFLGPAVVTSIAYIDPGNFATNIQAGARYGYRLLWVLVLANLVAMLFQALSAKLGIVAGRNLAELSRERFPRAVVWGMWGISEVAAMATDLAEFLGGAIGLALLLHVPLLAGMIVTGIVSYGILSLERTGFRPVELLIAPVDWRDASVSLVPNLPDNAALLLVVGIIGATVMPHAVYLHSGLTQSRIDAPLESERRLLVRFSNREVVAFMRAYKKGARDY